MQQEYSNRNFPPPFIQQYTIVLCANENRQIGDAVSEDEALTSIVTILLFHKLLDVILVGKFGNIKGIADRKEGVSICIEKLYT